jgi:hypothetical protein
MPLVYRARPLKRWRWIGLFCESLLICVGQAHVGPVRQSFWAVWDRERHRLRERTTVLRRGGVALTPGAARVSAAGIELQIALDEVGGIEAVCRSPRGPGYVWTRKQGDVAAAVTVRLGHEPARTVTGRAVIDDTAGYHDRHTEWWWTAGVGRSARGEAVAWSLVSGVNDPPAHSERTVWLQGIAHEVGPVRFAADLAAIEVAPAAAGDAPASADAASPAMLRFTAEAERRRRDELLLVSSDYRQPFGSFSGSLPGVGRLEQGLGVTEHHRARW